VSATFSSPSSELKNSISLEFGIDFPSAEFSSGIGGEGRAIGWSFWGWLREGDRIGDLTVLLNGFQEPLHPYQQPN
jgi:hypothetical protein